MPIDSKQLNKTLAKPDIDPLVPDANSIMATLIEATKSLTPTETKKLYRYASGTLTGANTASLSLQDSPEFWIIIIWGSGANTDYSVSEEGLTPYLGTAINSKNKLVIPAVTRTVTLSKVGNDVRYIIIGCTGYNTAEIA